MTITEEVEKIRGQIQVLLARIEWLERNQSKLEALPSLSPSSGMMIDFDNLTHPEIVKVVRTLGGKWTKTPADNNTINYEATVDGMTIRCWRGQPPPSCRIIEVEEHVPEQIIPASVRKVKKMICHPELPAVIATAAQKGASNGNQ